MKNEKYHTVGTVPISKRKIVKKRQNRTNTKPLTFLAWYRHLNKNNGRAKLVLCA